MNEPILFYKKQIDVEYWSAGDCNTFPDVV